MKIALSVDTSYLIKRIFVMWISLISFGVNFETDRASFRYGISSSDTDIIMINACKPRAVNK